MASFQRLPVLAREVNMKVISPVSCMDMFLFDLEHNHKPILNLIVLETWGNKFMETRPFSAINSTVYSLPV
jgi:hypothetical protein